jgi:hypothetical protein
VRLLIDALEKIRGLQSRIDNADRAASTVYLPVAYNTRGSSKYKLDTFGIRETRRFEEPGVTAQKLAVRLRTVSQPSRTGRKYSIRLDGAGVKVTRLS